MAEKPLVECQYCTCWKRCSQWVQSYMIQNLSMDENFYNYPNTKNICMHSSLCLLMLNAIFLCRIVVVQQEHIYFPSCICFLHHNNSTKHNCNLIATKLMVRLKFLIMNCHWVTHIGLNPLSGIAYKEPSSCKRNQWNEKKTIKSLPQKDTNQWFQYMSRKWGLQSKANVWLHKRPALNMLKSCFLFKMDLLIKMVMMTMTTQTFLLNNQRRKKKHQRKKTTMVLRRTKQVLADAVPRPTLTPQSILTTTELTLSNHSRSNVFKRKRRGKKKEKKKSRMKIEKTECSWCKPSLLLNRVIPYSEEPTEHTSNCDCNSWCSVLGPHQYHIKRKLQLFKKKKNFWKERHEQVEEQSLLTIETTKTTGT